MAVSNQDILNAVNDMVQYFDHDDERRHNAEIRQGAANVLCQKLMISMQNSRQYHRKIPDMQEQYGTLGDLVLIGRICKAFRFVYRCSAAIKEESFRAIGLELLPLLSRVVSTCLFALPERPNDVVRGPSSQMTVDHPEIGALEGALGALRNLSSVASAEKLMSNYDGFFDLLLKVENYDNVTIDAKVNCLNVIVNLAHCYENKATMVKNQRLLDMLVKHANHEEDMLRNAAACGLQNITAHDGNILIIIKHDGIIQAVLDLLRDKNFETREFAAGTIQNLSVSKKNSFPLVTFKGGRVVIELLKVISADSHDTVRNRSMWAMSNLICADTLFIIKLDGLVDTLAVAAAKDSIEDTRIQAALILKSCLSLLLVRLERFEQRHVN